MLLKFGFGGSAIISSWVQLHDFLATKKNARGNGNPSKGGSCSGKHQVSGRADASRYRNKNWCFRILYTRIIE